MQLTFIGFIVFIIGIWIFFFGSIEALLAFTITCTLMGGAAAFQVTVLGNSSVAPAQLALIFLAARIILPGGGRQTPFAAGVTANTFLLIFALYAVVSAGIMPRIFAGKIDVVPLKPSGLRNLFDVFPLEPTSQNITTAVYICGTFLFAVCTFIAARQPEGATRVVKTAIVIAVIHAALGILGAIAPSALWNVVLTIFRNGAYAQLDQTVEGYSRITGIMPEASAFAAFGVVWLIFMTELWIRDVLPRRTGPTAIAMAAVLIISTSSSAYVSLAAYVGLIVLRLAINPRLLRFDKVACLVGVIVAFIVAGALLFLLNPDLAHSLTNLLRRFTLDKANSDSGQQRAFWARQGLNAFNISYGLGIGAGSFRSSSIFTAVLGSMGIIGSAAYVCQILRTLQPLRQSTFSGDVVGVNAVGVAASWATIGTLIPAGIGAPSPDPGFIFAFFSGVALGLRSLARQHDLSFVLAAQPSAVLPAQVLVEQQAADGYQTGLR